MEDLFGYDLKEPKADMPWSWMQTFTGKQFWPFDPKVGDICIEDIAHSLSQQCRYAGHTKQFYSVAEHCYHISKAVPRRWALWGLLHDASEAYLIDVPRPVKVHLTNYKAIEAKLMLAIRQRFQLEAPINEGLGDEMPMDVKIADNKILMDERAQALSAPPADWQDEGPLLGVEIKFWYPQYAESRFLARFEELSK